MLHRPLARYAYRVSIAKKTSLLLTTATVLVSASVMMAPTPASAFNIGGLIAMASGHYGGYRGGHHGRVHEASRHSRHSTDHDDDDNAPASEKPPPGDKDTSLAQRHQDTGQSQHQPETGHDAAGSTVAFTPLR
jgi:hypothetical protein